MSTQVTVDGLNSKTTDSTTNNGRCSQIDPFSSFICVFLSGKSMSKLPFVDWILIEMFE